MSFEDNTIRAEDLVLVRVMGKKTVLYYVAEITNVFRKSNYQVKHVKRVENTNKLKWESEVTYYGGKVILMMVIQEKTSPSYWK